MDGHAQRRRMGPNGRGIDRLAHLGSTRGCRSPAASATGCSSFGSASDRQPGGITYRFTSDGRIVLLTTFRKQRNNERNEIKRARKSAEDCARLYP